MILVRLVAPLAALALALAACADDEPEPRVDPTPTVSTSTSVTPTPDPTSTGPVEPTLPPEAHSDNAAGAIAFVKFYWDMADFAQLTGDVDGLMPLATPECKACEGGVQAIQDAYGDGAVMRGGTTTLSRFRTTRVGAQDRRWMQVKFRVTSTRQVVDYPGEQRDVVHQAATVNAQFLLERQAGSWVVTFWEAS
jgi:hypothetical protein